MDILENHLALQQSIDQLRERSHHGALKAQSQYQLAGYWLADHAPLLQHNHYLESIGKYKTDHPASSNDDSDLILFFHLSAQYENRDL
jgi:hypothetical protein